MPTFTDGRVAEGQAEPFRNRLSRSASPSDAGHAQPAHDAQPLDRISLDLVLRRIIDHLRGTTPVSERN